MTAADDRILEFLLNEGNQELIATPGMIELNIDYGKTHINNRLRTLRNADLVRYEEESRGAYRITERGEEYLKGKLSAKELESPNNP